MEKNRIGKNAGIVWHALNAEGKLSTYELCRKTGLTFEEVVLAIGWLARENKIILRKIENMLYSSIEDNISFSFG